MFALFYDTGTGQISAINGSGRAPFALTLDKVRNTESAVQEDSLLPYHPLDHYCPWGLCRLVRPD